MGKLWPSADLCNRVYTDDSASGFGFDYLLASGPVVIDPPPPPGEVPLPAAGLGMLSGLAALLGLAGRRLRRNRQTA